jgi:hypothetical protein
MPEITAPKEAKPATARAQRLTNRNSLQNGSFFKMTDAKSQAVENSSRAMGKWVIAP